MPGELMEMHLCGLPARAAPKTSEGVRLVRAQSERGLQEDPIGGRALRRRVPLVPDHELGELAREKLQVSRGSVSCAPGGRFILKRVEASAEIAAPCELVSREGISPGEVPGGSAIGQPVWWYPTGELECRGFFVELRQEFGLEDERLVEALL